jgi:hypothetical protein
MPIYLVMRHFRPNRGNWLAVFIFFIVLIAFQNCTQFDMKRNPGEETVRHPASACDEKNNYRQKEKCETVHPGWRCTPSAAQGCFAALYPKEMVQLAVGPKLIPSPSPVASAAEVPTQTPTPTRACNGYDNFIERSNCESAYSGWECTPTGIDNCYIPTHQAPSPTATPESSSKESPQNESAPADAPPAA